MASHFALPNLGNERVYFGRHPTGISCTPRPVRLRLLPHPEIGTQVASGYFVLRCFQTFQCLMQTSRNLIRATRPARRELTLPGSTLPRAGSWRCSAGARCRPHNGLACAPHVLQRRHFVRWRNARLPNARNEQFSRPAVEGTFRSAQAALREKTAKGTGCF